MDSFIQKGSVGIKVNDDTGHYFQTHKGLRQGDLMSPILFNIVTDMLAVLIGRAKENDQVGGMFLILSMGEGVPYDNILMTLLYSWNMILQKP